MYKYQNINGWCILEDEEDTTMLHTAKKEKITECRWHEGYVDDIIIPYFLTSNRRTVIDAGASYGWMAVSFAKYFEEVKCFEIREDVRYALTENTSRFSNVEIFDCGLSDKKANVKVGLHNKTTGTTEVVRERNDGPAVEHPKGLLVNTLDSFNFNRVDCIKMDIENHEYYALLGALDTIKKWKPVLILEISYTKKRYFDLFERRQRIFKLLRSVNYEIVDVRGKDLIFAHKSRDPYNGLDL